MNKIKNDSENNENFEKKKEEKNPKTNKFKEVNIVLNKSTIFSRLNIKEYISLKIEKIKQSPFCITFQKYFWDIIYYFLTISSIILYFLSLESCGIMSANLCTIIRGHQYYFKVIKLTITSCILASTFITILLFRCKGFKHLIYFIPIYFFYFQIYTGTNTDEHGLFNSMGFFLAMFLYVFFTQIILYIIYFILKKQFKNLIILIDSFIILYLSFNLYSPSTKCIKWEYGLNNSFIDNHDKYPCKIQFPPKCILDKYTGYLDFSKIFRPNCEMKNIRNVERKWFNQAMHNMKYFDEKYNHFGYPITTQKRFGPDPKNPKHWIDEETWAQFVHNNTIIMDLYNEINYPNEPPPEVELKFNRTKGTIYQHINFNKTLSEERKKLSEKYKTLYDNVFIFFIDTLSRKHFIRKLPKTSKLIEKYYHSKKDKNPKASSYQFLKYSNFRAATQNNIMPMFYGKSMKSSSGVSILKHLKKYGYITSGSLNQCHREVYDLQHYLDHNVKYEPFDHENFALFCDPNFSMPNYPFSYIKGIYSSFRRCLYGKDTTEYVLEFTQKFWDAYINERKYSRLSFIDAHEGTMEVVKYLDQHLFNFLNNFIEKYLNNNTTIFIVSDHGENMVSINTFFNGDDYFFEKSLGVFFLILPENSNLKINESNIIDNEQKFITPYDIHDTIIDIINGNEYSDNGISVFQKIDSLKRNCDSYNDDYDDKKRFCSCLNYRRK
jgi:hypothetical protein